MVTNVIAVESPAREESGNCLGDFGHFLANPGRFGGLEAILLSVKPFLRPKDLTYDHLTKIKRLVIDVIAIGKK